MRRNGQILGLVITVMLLGGCAGTHHVRGTARLDQAAALALAVDLANEECDERYAVRPFDSASYSVAFLGDRWHWGEIDPAGVRGYSATVSFDAYGEERHAEVAFHLDKSLYQ